MQIATIQIFSLLASELFFHAEFLHRLMHKLQELLQIKQRSPQVSCRLLIPSQSIRLERLSLLLAATFNAYLIIYYRIAIICNYHGSCERLKKSNRNSKI